MHSLIEQRRDEIARICTGYGVRRLDVFGFAGAGGGFDSQRSDFDFLVEFGNHKELPDVGTYLRFRDALAGLLGPPVDLITAHSVRNPCVRAEIEHSREPGVRIGEALHQLTKLAPD